MFPKTPLFALFIGLQLTACKEAPPLNAAQEATREVTATQPLRQAQPISDGDTLTCSQQCGAEARGTVYADCMADGGERQTCGSTGRDWYRECLESRCDASAIVRDDCRTDCRINGKQEEDNCTSETGNLQECRDKRITSVDECIAVCGQ